MGTDPIQAVEEALIDTSSAIRSAFTVRGSVDRENPSGEQQLRADVRADELLIERLGKIHGIGMYASEERDSTHDVGDGYSVTVDPLDGSSNLESNNPVGTIVGLYDEPLPTGGQSLEAAWFLVYGPLTTMISMRAGDVTEAVIVDRAIKDRGSIRLPEEPTVYGFGGRKPDWPRSFAAFADEIAHELKLRYGGSLVGDVNQVLRYGGMFSYPALESAPRGKLRLQFEAIPMAAIVEAAGGESSNGSESLLSVEPDELHQRTPVHLGNKALIDRLETALS